MAHFATALGWGATRAWQVEAQIRAAGLMEHNSFGKAALTPDKSVSVAVQNQRLNPPVAPKKQVAEHLALGVYKGTKMPGPDPYGIEIGPDYPQRISVLVYHSIAAAFYSGGNRDVLIAF